MVRFSCKRLGAGGRKKIMKALSLYIHIPFCTSKCLYCDFTSRPIGGHLELVEKYIDALVLEIDLYKEVLSAHVIKSIFFGGGTPSCIEGHFIASLLKHISKWTSFDEEIEITIECNPETLTADKLITYKNAGVNRLSIGLQSTHNNLLVQIGRQHNYETFVQAFKLAKKIGFDNINVDLMFGLPGQNLEQFKESIKEVLGLKPQHIASYSLKIEEGTPFFVLEKKGHIQLVDENEERNMYHVLIDLLEKEGYFQYELSNFSLENHESKHNLVYWENKPYIGFGLSAHSKVDAIRCHNVSELDTYIDLLNDHQKPIESSVDISVEDDLFETIMLGLRLNKGISPEAIGKQYGIDFKTKYENELKDLLSKGLIVYTGNRLKLTPLGRDLSNQVFVSFL